MDEHERFSIFIEQGSINKDRWYASYGRVSAAADSPLEAIGNLMILLEELDVIDIEWPNGRRPEEVTK